MAAALAGGDEALVSRRSATELWGLVEPIPGPVHVTRTASRRRQPGIVFHRARDIGEHRTVRHAIPVTTVERTLLDLAGTVGHAALRRSVEEADRLGVLDLDTLDRLCDRAAGRKGVGSLRALLSEHRPLADTRSELERALLRECRRHGLPAPATNVPVEGFEVDCLWPPARLVVELDGYAYHRSRASFERDRARDAALQVAGYRVVRVTHRMLAERPQSVLETIRTMLAVS